MNRYMFSLIDVLYIFHWNSWLHSKFIHSSPPQLYVSLFPENGTFPTHATRLSRSMTPVYHACLPLLCSHAIRAETPLYCLLTRLFPRKKFCIAAPRAEKVDSPNIGYVKEEMHPIRYHFHAWMHALCWRLLICIGNLPHHGGCRWLNCDYSVTLIAIMYSLIIALQPKIKHDCCRCLGSKWAAPGHLRSPCWLNPDLSVTLIMIPNLPSVLQPWTKPCFGEVARSAFRWVICYRRDRLLAVILDDVMTSRWVNARNTQLQCFNNGVTSFLQ